MTYQPKRIRCRNCFRESIKVAGMQAFCSADCLTKFNKDKSRPGINKTAKVCETCGKTFYVINGKRVLANQRFCSHRCTCPAKPLRKLCANCGKEFDCSREMDKFCSKSCAGKYRYQKNKSH